jgi:hypothetical protein
VVVLKHDGINQTIIAPNPVKDALHVAEPSPVFVRSAEVYSMNGALLLQKEINSTVQVFGLAVHNLSIGSYVLKINYQNETRAYPFIKQ